MSEAAAHAGLGARSVARRLAAQILYQADLTAKSPSDVLADAARYLTEGFAPIVSLYEGRPIGVELPAAVVLVVTRTDPGVKGDRVSGALKPATLETGLTVQVPLFVEEGDRVKVDTRTGQYLTREK